MQANDTMMAIDDEQQPSSEEKAEDPDTASLTPAQSKRKAQNRAAYVSQLFNSFLSLDLYFVYLRVLLAYTSVCYVWCY